jgi:aryl-alcohol dehydrogenase-like predicted oxidoreductase
MTQAYFQDSPCHTGILSRLFLRKMLATPNKKAVSLQNALLRARTSFSVDIGPGVNRLLFIVLQEKGVGVINASPLAMGLLTEQGPPTWHPASNEIKVHLKSFAIGTCTRNMALK